MGTLLEQVDEVLAAEPPDPLFATSWEQAAALVPELGTLLGEWFNEEIDAATVIAEVAPLRAEIDAMTSAVEDELARTYGVDRSQLQQFRQDTMDELRATLTEGSSDE